MPKTQIEEAVALMQSFAERSGIADARPGRRYLWTDAFAVCNFLGLAETIGVQAYQDLALQLIDRVHHTLGKYRDDDTRVGWISGLNHSDGEQHPTRGGLRIGKPLAERGPDESVDERREWDRDGQYFHYLTKWMHALDQAARATHQPRFNLWARELAETAFHAFVPTTGDTHGRQRMYWKMSTDLTRPLVAAMGQHDPLDGYITANELHATAAVLDGAAAQPGLEAETRQYGVMIRRGEWATGDPLGLGGLLSDAWRVAQLAPRGRLPDGLPGAALLTTLLSAALAGLKYYAERAGTQLPPDHRVAFRELGLAIGLHAVERMWQNADRSPQPPFSDPRVRTQVQALMHFASLGEEIEAFWRNPEHRRGDTWLEHQDINEVMLATCLAPEGFLVLRGSGSADSNAGGGRS